MVVFLKLTLFIKRAFDILFSFLGIVIIWPFLLIIALIVVIDSPGGAIYKQERIGKDGKPFNIFKFRTMMKNTGLELTLANDGRVTRVGGFLRKYKLDELPQLFNVLGGSMSLVGPRPEVRKYVEMYNDEQRRVLSIKPGVTDMASIKYSDETSLMEDPEEMERIYINTIMPDKLRLNLEYIDNLSVMNDIKIIFATLKKIFI